MLSDHEQRALDELERCYAAEAREPHRSGRRSNRPPGFRTVVVLGSVSLALVLVDVPAAAVSLALATAMAWLFWRLWSHRTGDGSLPTPRGVPGHGGSVQQYLRWLGGVK